MPLTIPSGSVSDETKQAALVSGTNIKTINGATVLGSGDLSINTSGGATETTSAVDITLTSASDRVQVVNMSATGKAVYLPDATTLSEGGTTFAFSATGSDYIVRDSAGSLIATVTALTTLSVFLANNSTAAGTWVAGQFSAVGGAMIPGTVKVVNAVNTLSMSIAMLSATKAIVTYKSNATGFLEAVVLDVSGSTITNGTIRAVNATAIGSYTSVTALSPTQAICVYGFGGSVGLYATVLDISGSSITEGVAKAITGYATYFMRVAKLSSTKAICVFQGTSSYVESVVLDISGSTITNGTVRVNNAEASAYMSICALSSTKALCGYTAGGFPKAIILDVSGSSITEGSPYTVLGSGSNLYTNVAMLNATKAIYAFNDSTNSLTKAVVLTVAASTISAGSTYTAFSSTAGYEHGAISALSETEAVMVSPIANYLRYGVLRINGTVITPGTITTSTIYANGGQDFYAAALTSGKIIAAMAGTSSYLNSVILEDTVAL